MHQRLSRLRIVTACCGAVVAALVLKHTAALAQSAGSCGVAHSAAGCGIDTNGCEIVQGINTANYCNQAARSDGSQFLVYPVVLPPTSTLTTATSRFDTVSSVSGSTSFATLYCTDGDSINRSTALFRGVLTAGDSKLCNTNAYPLAYAYRMICGPYKVCGDATNPVY